MIVHEIDREVMLRSDQLLFMYTVFDLLKKCK